jgi:hypothetical protein
MTIYLRRENRKRDEAARLGRPVIGVYTEEMAAEEREKGDYAEGFRYTI